MVLQFDEVDALMGKRTDIKEARDRYANLEVSYLLARMEQHQGPCILTTNLRTNIDSAFVRRFQMVVEFPRPDHGARKKLWANLFPPQAPMCDKLDMAYLADAVNLTGGSICNVTQHAAYLAAEANSSINYQHIAIAVYRELAKARQQFKAQDMGALFQHLPPELLTNQGGEP